MVEQRIHTLTYAVRGDVVLKYSGQLALMLTVVTLVPGLFAASQSHWDLAMRYAILCGALGSIGAWLARLPTPVHVQSNEALTVTALAFTVSPLLMSWPLMSSGISFVDALFEAISAVTTTGLSTLSNIETQPATFLFARAWMQWCGGLGIVVLSVALLMGHHAAARRLVDPVLGGDTLVVTARTHARHSLIVYLSLTVLGLLLLVGLVDDNFSAVLHTLSAVSTGGFSSYNSSLAGLDSRMASATVIAISFLGAVSLPLYWRMAHRGWRGGALEVINDLEFRALILMCVIIGTTLGIFGWMHNAGSPWYHGFMMGISAQTTTGFASTPVSAMDPGSKVVMIVAMLTGGSVGSSAGGFKLLRLLILFRLFQLMIQRAGMSAHAVSDTYLGEQRLENDDLLRALQLILLFIILAFLSWLPFVVYGYDPLDALFEVVSAIATVGLSSGITGPELTPLLKGVLCFDMLAGRLEILALLVILYPGNWVGRREQGQ